jgi:hypothetical protein
MESFAHRGRRAVLTKEDLTSLLSAVGEVVKGYVSRVRDDLSARLDQFEQRMAELPVPKDGKDGVDGKDGRNAYEVAVSLGFEGTVHEWMESLVGKQGMKGDAGTMATVADIRPVIEEMFREIPVPKDGIDGKDGKDGVDGKSVTLTEVRPLVEEAFKAVSVPKDGKDGRDGVDGKNGTDGKGVTVEDFRPMFEAELAKAMLEQERRATDLIQRCIDRIEKPKDGKDGRDAFDLGDIQVSLADDERTLTLAFVRGQERIERSVTLTHPIYHGVWREGGYVKGDSVTYGGSTWIATRKTNSKPELDDSWRLSVKRGRDGKDGAKGERGLPGRDASALRL